MVNDDKVQEGKFRENATDSANLQQGSFSEEVKNSDRKEEVNGALIKMVKVMGCLLYTSDAADDWLVV